MRLLAAPRCNLRRARRALAPLVLPAALACAALSSGCVESSKGRSSDSSARLSAYVLDAPPAIAHKLDTNLENKIRLLGYKLEPEGVIAPGREAKLTLYWRVDERPGDGWQLFTHVLDDSGTRLAAGNIDNAGPLREASSGRQALPPSDWQKGKVYVDEQPFKMPDDATAEVTLVTGIWRGDDRLKIVGPGGDREHRAAAAQAPPRLTPPSLRVLKAVGVAAPKIDGKLDDDIWRRATFSGPLVDVSNGQPNSTFPVNAVARIAWDDKNLYLGFEVQDDKLIGGFKPGDKDPHLWEKECVEIMIDPDGDGDNKDYYEIQISPQNLVFDSQFDEYNKPRGGPNGPFGHQEWSIKGATAVAVNGTLDDDSDKDHGYTVEAAIPWTSFSKARHAPPAPGDAWRMNLYAMKRNGGVAWSPILGEGNFHKATRFGRVFFVTGAATPMPRESASAPASSAPPPPAPKPPAPKK
jgi:hypothetical protein